MHLHTVTIPATNPDEDVAAALKREGTFDELTRAGVSVTFAPVPQPGETDDPVLWVARLGAGIAAKVREGLEADTPVLIVGGNCNALIGVLGGFQGAYGPAAKIGLVWFDAHGDFNTPKTTITGRLGGMPVAVATGLAFPSWRAIAGMATPIPTDRILMVDVRNLDPKEQDLIAATDVRVVGISRTHILTGLGRLSSTLADTIEDFARDCDVLYLHIDEDILDRAYVPNHGTAESNGPDITAVQTAVQAVLATGKVHALGLVSVYLAGDGAATSLASAAPLLTTSVRDWQRVANV